MEVLKQSSLTTADILIDNLVPNPHNINEMNEETLQRLVDEIKEVGFIDPINVVPVEGDKYVILGGDHRKLAAGRAGMMYVPCIIHSDAKWTDQDLFELVSLRLNVLKGSQNPEKFMKLYERLALKFGTEKLQDIFAVTDKSIWKKLTKGIKSSLKNSGMPEDLVDDLGQAADKAKDFKQFTKYLDKVLKEHAQSVANGCVVFMNGKNEYAVIQASQTVFDSVKALQALSSSQGKNINEFLEPMLMGALHGG